ncbi:hypothetical protein [Lacticaseibacillus paracasei]|uniref:hypothetical protein n=1 Tax=Lacticaseibacillus paracasei TaxID=1597 RepID=UPI003B9EB50C
MDDYTLLPEDGIYSLSDLIELLKKFPPNATVHVCGNFEDRPIEEGSTMTYDPIRNSVTFMGDVAMID